MKSRWFSPRAFVLHLTMLGWVGGCVAAAWWQVGRASQGNTLSYMYAVEWPVFAIMGVVGWWALLHVEESSAETLAARQKLEQTRRHEAEVARQVDAADEDPTMAAYNDHLARLASQPKRKLLGH